MQYITQSSAYRVPLGKGAATSWHWISIIVVHSADAILSLEGPEGALTKTV